MHVTVLCCVTFLQVGKLGILVRQLLYESIVSLFTSVTTTPNTSAYSHHTYICILSCGPFVNLLCCAHVYIHPHSIDCTFRFHPKTPIQKVTTRRYIIMHIHVSCHTFTSIIEYVSFPHSQLTPSSPTAFFPRH